MSQVQGEVVWWPAHTSCLRKASRFAFQIVPDLSRSHERILEVVTYIKQQQQAHERTVLVESGRQGEAA
jgi:hypothetical protein